MAIEEAALESARLRFRPILMTAFAFILGVVPLMRASGAGAGAQNVMGTAVFWGMLVATALGVFLIPGNYAFVESLGSQEAGAGEDGRTEPPVAGHAEERRTERGDADGAASARVAVRVLAVALLAAGCTLGPDYVRPEVPGARGLARARPPSEQESLANTPWWELFQDPELRGPDRDRARREQGPADRGRAHRGGARLLRLPARGPLPEGRSRRLGRQRARERGRACPACPGHRQRRLALRRGRHRSSGSSTSSGASGARPRPSWRCSTPPSRRAAPSCSRSSPTWRAPTSSCATSTGASRSRAGRSSRAWSTSRSRATASRAG